MDEMDPSSDNRESPDLKHLELSYVKVLRNKKKRFTTVEFFEISRKAVAPNLKILLAPQGYPKSMDTQVVDTYNAAEQLYW